MASLDGAPYIFCYFIVHLLLCPSPSNGLCLQELQQALQAAETSKQGAQLDFDQLQESLEVRYRPTNSGIDSVTDSGVDLGAF